MSNRMRRIFVYLALFLCAGHLFDLALGLGWNRSIAWFGAITDIYSRWDPTYVAQPFYMEITSLLSGIVMIPATLAIAHGFHRRLSFVKWLVPMYAGFIICNNVSWYWNEFFCPEPPVSWFMMILFSSPWWVLPSVIAYATIDRDFATVTGGEPARAGQRSTGDLHAAKTSVARSA